VKRLLALLCLPLVLAAAQAKFGEGSPLPQFARADLSGRPFDSAGLRGKVVLIDFWASWCAPCMIAMPHLIGMQKKYGPRGLQVVGISMDDSPAPAKAVAGRFAFNYPLLLGDAKLGNRFGGVLGLPEEMLVARNGKILKIWSGEVAPAELDRAVQAAIN
jgi:cytochrome c biogenesis protein CcmG/thiol:disulfide interchange protein DsbE